MASAVADSLDVTLSAMAAVLSKRWALTGQDGSIKCLKCGERADSLVLHCGRCLLARYALNYPGSEYQLWPAPERILRSDALDERGSRALLEQARDFPNAPTGWLRALDSIVRARFAPDPDADWRTR